jgi:hypothetical protein
MAALRASLPLAVSFSDGATQFIVFFGNNRYSNANGAERQAAFAADDRASGPVHEAGYWRR